MEAGPAASEARGRLVERLRSRKSEIGESILARVRGLPSSTTEARSGSELALTVAATVEHGFATIEVGAEHINPLPATILMQGHTAARAGFPLDTLLRRYVAGHTLLADFVIDEASDSGLTDDDLKTVLRDLAVVFDRVVAAVSEEFLRAATQPMDSNTRRVERVRRLLAGEPLSPSTIDYDLEGFHLGVIAVGSQAVEKVRELRRHVDCRLLVVEPEESRAWGWLGHRRDLDPEETKMVLSQLAPDLAVAIGEPMQRLGGWRLTHRQAKAALPIAIRNQAAVRYVEVALLASLIGDNLLCSSLQELYLAPLADAADGGAKMRQTLRAYIAARRNVSSTAAALGVSRRTVNNRLRVAERRIGRPLDPEMPALEAALALEDLKRGDPADSATVFPHW